MGRGMLYQVYEADDKDMWCPTVDIMKHSPYLKLMDDSKIIFLIVKLIEAWSK